jgi:hypothetical protein
VDFGSVRERANAMTRFIIPMVGAGALWLTSALVHAQAQVVYYAPAPVTVAAVVPRTVYYAPAPTTTYYAPAPVTTYYAPAAAPVVSPAPVVAAPVPVTTTYYRPLLGGTITRTRYVYPAVTYPAAAPAVTYYAPY